MVLSHRLNQVKFYPLKKLIDHTDLERNPVALHVLIEVNKYSLPLNPSVQSVEG